MNRQDSRTGIRNDIGVTLHRDATDDNRLDRENCARHGDSDGLLTNPAWDALSGSDTSLKEKR